ncbi:MAG TPA: hypothetical protein ENH94_06140, partial [Phycisphaerales bacterium]|nr:hypothetical protein [Phycisphaerales bacterium]
MKATNMRIEQLKLHNFRGIKELEFEFSEKLNLFVGVNGSGKSTVLDSMAIALSWFVNRIQRENGRGRGIKESDIYNGQPEAFIDLSVCAKNASCGWLLARSASGKYSGVKSQLGGASLLANCIREEFEENSSFPVIAYYPVERVVKNFTRDFLVRSSDDELGVYENALDGRANFHSFFNWFLAQDNILNEQAVSRTKWMVQNRSKVKRRVNKVLSLLQKSFPDEMNTHHDNEFAYLLRRFRKDEMVLEEPRFLFRELSELIHMIGRGSYKDFEETFHDLEYMFRKMSSLSGENRDNLIKSGGIHKKIVKQISRRFMNVGKLEIPENMVDFLWECFSFATWLSLWWLTDESKRKVERLFSACHPLRPKAKRALLVD